MSRLTGRICGMVVSTKLAVSQPSVLATSTTEVSNEDEAESRLLTSDLWNTLLRGGYRIGRLQRSLSGNITASSIDTETHLFIKHLALQDTDLTKLLIHKCMENHRGHKLGGPDVDEAVLATFSALLWHTQTLRDEIDKYIECEGAQPVSDGLLQAYTVADSIRNHILDLRQRQKLSEEKDAKDSDSKEDFALVFKEKAVFLLSFAGLTKILPRIDSHHKKSSRFKKISTHRRPSNLQQDRSKHDFFNDKFPSFRLVLEFIKDPVWRKEKVEELLHQRASHAQAVADTYMLASEYMRIMSDPDIFQVTIIIFLRELLRRQSSFNRHYADGLEGCGLELETSVRRAYYTLLRRLIDAVMEGPPQAEKKIGIEAFDYVRACLLHLLNINWQSFDFAFLWETKLPVLLMDIAKGSVATRSYGRWEAPSTEEEVKQYEQNLLWLTDCKRNFSSWHEKSKLAPREERKAQCMFVARFCDLLNVEINCDGCCSTLPGRRFRCIDCEDIDLCSTCFAGGVAPTAAAPEHTDDHQLVHLMYKCNGCKAFIVGTRVHCTECDDFDLCVGCDAKQKYPQGHDASHGVRNFPIKTLTNLKKLDTGLPAYIHQHVWLLYSSLALTMSHLHNHQLLQQPYLTYTSQLHDLCINQLMQCLQHVPASGDECSAGEDMNAVIVPENEDLPGSEKMELAFAVHSQERIMGLLGAMIPENSDHQPETVHLLQTESFLTLLFIIAKGEGGHDVNTQHLAMGMLARLLHKPTTSCQVSDEAVAAATSSVIPTDSTPGDHTVQHLISFGAKCLERSGLEWACSVVSSLQTLYTAPAWRTVLEKHIRLSIDNVKKSPHLTSIFALFVVAGFPEVLSVGATVKYSTNGLDQKDGVVLKHFPDKHQSLIVDRKTRRRHMTKDEFVSVCSPCIELYHDNNRASVTAGLLDTITNVISQIKDGCTPTVERMWILALSLKTLHRDLRTPYSSNTNSYHSSLYTTEFLQCVVYLACQGTQFEKQWLLKDLEILSLLLYTMCHSQKSKLLTTYYTEPRDLDLSITTSQEAMKALSELSDIQSRVAGFGTSATDSEDTTDTDTDTSDHTWSSNSNTNLAKAVSGPEMSPDVKKHLKSIHEALNIPLTVVSDLYTDNNKDLREVIDALNSHLISLVESLKEDPKKDSTMYDEGIRVGRSSPTLAPNTNNSSLSDIVALEEPCEKGQALVHSTDHDVQKDVQKQIKQKSADLLNEALKEQTKSSSKEFLVKVNRAISVLYARDVVISLLADWPVNKHPLTSRILGCESDNQIPCLIDMLYNTDSLESVKKMVDNLMRTCDESCLIAVSESACQFVEEQSLTAVCKESEHNYKNNTELEDKVYIPGASFLSVRFDSRCHTEEACDVLVLATTPDYKQNKWSFSGCRENWRDFEVPGDTLYFKFTSDRSKNEWGYKFTVMGGRIGRFDTGFMILDALLLAQSSHRALPLAKIWTSLCHVVSRQTGTQRLRIIHLLLKIIHTQTQSRETELSIRASLLAPLWQLYVKMSSVPVEPGSIVSPLVRALTELFTVVETLVLDYGVDVEFSAAIRTPTEWNDFIKQGVLNVTAVSLVTQTYNKLTHKLLPKESDS